MRLAVVSCPATRSCWLSRADLVVCQAAVDLGDRHHRQHVVGQRIATFVRGDSIRDQVVDEREDLAVRRFSLLVIAAAEEVDDVVGPPAEVVTSIPRHAEQRSDDDRREREREQRDEVALTVVIERPVPQILGDLEHVVVEAGERGWSERVLQDPAMTSMIGVVGGAEHAGR